MASLAGSPSVASFSCIRPNQATAPMASLNAVSFSARGNFSSASLRSAPSRLHICYVAKPETVKKVYSIVMKQLGISDKTVLSRETSFVDDLGADSLDTVEIVMLIEEEFEITVEEESARTINTIQDAADLIEDLVAKKKILLRRRTKRES